MDEAMQAKDLEYYLNLNFAKADKATHLSLVQPHVSGGRITREQLHQIEQHPEITEITVSGLKQDTFEHFVLHYGRQFKAIHFWKCPLVTDLSPIGTLADVEYLLFFWNQRAERLWDFSGTPHLKGLAFDDFTRMHDLADLEHANALEELHFGDMIWSKYTLNSLSPLAACKSLKNLNFSARKILDARIEPIASLQSLERLDFPTNLFTTQQVAWLKAHLPPTVESDALAGHQKLAHPIPYNGKDKDILIVGKGKPLLDSTRDRKRLDKYLREFDAMHDWFLHHPAALPEDYPEVV